MASLLIEDNVYEIRVRAVVAGTNQEFDNIFNYTYTTTTPGVPSTLTANDLLITWRQAFRAGLLPQLPASYRVQVYELRTIIGKVIPALPAKPKLTYSDLVIQPGDPTLDIGGRTGSLDLLPPYASVSVESRIDKVGRQWFGIRRIGPVCEIDQNTGTLTPTAVVAWQTAVDWMVVRQVLPGGGGGVERAVPVLFRKKAFLGAPGGLIPSAYAQWWDRINVAEELGTQLSRKQPIRRFGY